MFTINVKSEFKDKVLSDILITAIEGGINYWCSSAFVIDAISEEKVDINVLDIPRVFDFDNDEDADYNKHLIKFVLHEPIKDDGTDYYMSYNDLVEAVQTWCENNEALSLRLDFDNLDAEDCDQIVQIALFGKVIYG